MDKFHHPAVDDATHPSKRSARVVWLACALGFASCVAVRVLQIEVLRARVQQRNDLIQSVQARSDPTVRLVDSLLGRSRQDVARKFLSRGLRYIRGGSVHYIDLGMGEFQLAIFVDPRTDVTYELHFGKDGLMSFFGPRWPPLSFPPAWEATESVREFICRYGIAVWLVLTLLSLALRTVRSHAPTIALAISGACAVNWALSVPYFAVKTIWELNWIGSVLASCFLLGWFYRRNRRERNPHLSQTCSYDLTGNESGICPECGSLIPAT